jgi:hypothetical protein
VQDIQKWFGQDLWHEMGANIVIGLVNGITGGAASAVQAAIGLAKSIRGAFQGALDMHSPSRAMFEDGQNAAKGSELGLRAGTPGVASASDDMAEAARVGTRRGGSSGAAAADGANGPAGSQILIQFGEKAIVIEAGGAAKPADIMLGLKAGLVELLRDAAAKGLAPA